MSMQSLDLLEQLRDLPSDEEPPDSTFANTVSRIRAMDRDLFIVEISLGTEEVMERLFDAYNLDDTLAEAHGLSFPDYDAPLHQHYQEALTQGPSFMDGFISSLKEGVLALKTESALESYFPEYDFEITPDASQGIWDIQSFGADGAQNILLQVKTGARSYAPDALESIQDVPDTLFSVSRDVYDEILRTSPELSARVLDTGVSGLDMSADITQDIGLLAGRAGFDSPDAIGEMLPYVGEIVIGIKLVSDLVSTERNLKDVRLTDRSRIHALKTLVLMSKFGVTTVCATAGSMAGGGAGTLAMPGVGTAAGGVIGGVSGAVFAAVLNRKLRSRVTDIAMHLSGVDEDEFFYLHNKRVADGIAESMMSTKAV